MKFRFIFLFLLVGLVLAGCVQPSVKSTENTTVINQTSVDANVSNVSSTAYSNETVQVASAALCRVVSQDQSELFLVDSTRYAYELQVNGSARLEMVFVNDTLYLHYLPPVEAGCEWIFLTADDLNSVDSLGGVQLLTHSELVARLSVDTCQSVPLMEQLFAIPSKACPIREALLRSRSR